MLTPDDTRFGRLRLLLRLFGEMFFIALFVLGGGFAILAVAEQRFSRKLKWLKDGELMGMMPVFQMVPGIVAGHTAVYLGDRLAGPFGAAFALVGTVLPSILVFTAVTVFYDRIPVESVWLAAVFTGLRASIAGILADLAVRSWKKSVPDFAGALFFAVALVLMAGFGVSPGWVLLGGMVAGVAFVRARDRCADAAPRRTFPSFGAIPLVFLVYGLIAFGGGYVLVPVYVRDFVGETARYLQLAPHEFANVMALTQMTPGPIGINCATFFGYRMGGIPGAFAASFCLVLPGYVILLVALRSLERFRSSVFVRGVFAGVRPVTMAMLLMAAFLFAKVSVLSCGGDAARVNPTGCLLILFSFFVLRRRWLGAVPAILISAALSLAFTAVAVLKFS